MFFISEILKSPPASFCTPLQKKTYETLTDLSIPYERVTTDEAIKMEDCIQINQKLDMKMVKTLFLCNRQQTHFFLFMTTAEKPFNSKAFSERLGISRVSFAPTHQLEDKLGVKIGAATVFGILMDTNRAVQVVLDEDVVNEEWYGCSDGTTTGYMKIKTKHVVYDFLTYAKHMPKTIQI
jgi:Ala-tRNA(Pro) deacylase